MLYFDFGVLLFALYEVMYAWSSCCIILEKVLPVCEALPMGHSAQLHKMAECIHDFVGLL